MKRYTIKVIKKYEFTIEGENKEDIDNKVNTIINESDILNLPYVKRNVKIKIREKRRKNEEK